MASDRLRRKLAAILYADVAGYSRLTSEDEDATHLRLSLCLDLISETVDSHQGKVMHFAGDAVLAKFDAVVDALGCAVAIQKQFGKQNSALSENQKVAFRIGVNLGDVIEDRGDIYGDGVNVAARLEGLAYEGGICISESVYTAIGNRLPLCYEYMGEQQVKNIDRPVRAYHVLLDAEKPKEAVSSIESGQASSEKPSLAVFPLANLSDSAEQEFFCDGITDDLITALSRSSWFNVMSRNSTFAFKGGTPDVREVAHKLGVAYVLEGSVRSQNDRVRINVQLVDAVSGSQVWAQRFIRRQEDGFEVQDEIAHRVASVLSERIWQDVARTISKKQPESYGAYDCAYLGIEALHHLDPGEMEKAKGYLNRALELDDDLIPGHLGLDFCYICDYAYWDDPSNEALNRAKQHAIKLQTLAPDDAQTYRLLSRVYTALHRFDEAQQCVERALRINPDDGDIIGNKGLLLLFSGDFKDSIKWFDKVLELHADTPHTMDIMHFWKSLAQFMAADYQAAVATLKKINGLDYLQSLLSAACNSQLNRLDEARADTQHLLSIRPNLRISDIGLCHYFSQEQDRLHLLNALRSAGLPDTGPDAQSPKLPDKPSIAVLAFTNMSSDSEQEYFSDGITEDIITELSRFPSLFVIARNSSFAFKGKPVDIKTISKTLGVRYVLEGSVRRAGNRIRINAQLLDSELAGQIWAERYDGSIVEIFDFQDEITRNIVGSIAPQVEIAEVERVRKLPAANLTSYELSLKAQALFHDWANEGNPEIMGQAIETAEKALELDTRNSGALWVLGIALQCTTCIVGERIRNKALRVPGKMLSALFELTHRIQRHTRHGVLSTRWRENLMPRSLTFGVH